MIIFEQGVVGRMVVKKRASQAVRLGALTYMPAKQGKLLNGKMLIRRAKREDI